MTKKKAWRKRGVHHPPRVQMNTYTTTPPNGPYDRELHMQCEFTAPTGYEHGTLPRYMLIKIQTARPILSLPGMYMVKDGRVVNLKRRLHLLLSPDGSVYHIAGLLVRRRF
jgi:hypothetical protein